MNQIIQNPILRDSILKLREKFDSTEALEKAVEHSINKNVRTFFPEVIHQTEVVSLKPTVVSSIDKHYKFNHEITDTERDQGFIKVDPYFVSTVWELGKKDPSGCLFHMLKNIARFSAKEGNTTQREVDGLFATLKRFCELNGFIIPKS